MCRAFPPNCDHWAPAVAADASVMATANKGLSIHEAYAIYEPVWLPVFADALSTIEESTSIRQRRASLAEAALPDWLSRRMGGKLCTINPEGELQ